MCAWYVSVTIFAHIQQENLLKIQFPCKRFGEVKFGESMAGDAQSLIIMRVYYGHLIIIKFTYVQCEKVLS